MSASEIFSELLKLPAHRTHSDEERLVWSVGRLALECEMNGLSGFLFNISPRESGAPWAELRATIGRLELVGANGAAQVLARLLPRLESLALDDGTWSGFLAARGIELQGLDAELESHDELFDCLDAYLAS
jgi:hypothetical protein